MKWELRVRHSRRCLTLDGFFLSIPFFCKCSRSFIQCTLVWSWVEYWIKRMNTCLLWALSIFHVFLLLLCDCFTFMVLSTPFFWFLCVFFLSVILFPGLITTTARKLDRENQSEHILEVCNLCYAIHYLFTHAHSEMDNFCRSCCYYKAICSNFGMVNMHICVCTASWWVV